MNENVKMVVWGSVAFTLLCGMIILYGRWWTEGVPTISLLLMCTSFVMWSGSTAGFLTYFIPWMQRMEARA